MMAARDEHWLLFNVQLLLLPLLFLNKFNDSDYLYTLGLIQKGRVLIPRSVIQIAAEFQGKTYPLEFRNNLIDAVLKTDWEKGAYLGIPLQFNGHPWNSARINWRLCKSVAH